MQTQALNPNLTLTLESLEWQHTFVISVLRRWGQTTDPRGLINS